MTFQPIDSIAPFITASTVLPEDYSQLLIRLTTIFNDIAYKVNAREIAFYEPAEQLTGQAWFSANPNLKRQTFRKVYSFGAILTGATLNIPHNIPDVFLFTHIYGTILTDVPDQRPLPRVSATLVTDQVSLDVGAVNIVIVNGATAPNITSGFVVLEYLKN